MRSLFQLVRVGRLDLSRVGRRARGAGFMTSLWRNVGLASRKFDFSVLPFFRSGLFCFIVMHECHHPLVCLRVVLLFIIVLLTRMATMAHALSSSSAAHSRGVASAVAKELFLQCSDGIKLAGEYWKKETSEGESTGPEMEPSKQHKILCLHGWMDNCRSFHHLAPYLIQNLPCGTELFAMDFPGHGLSSHKSIDGPPAMLSELAYYVAEAREQLQWSKDEPFIMIGHSMGAAVSCVYSAAFPEQVKSVILLEGAGPLARNTGDVARHVRQHVQKRMTGNQSDREPRIYPSLEKAVQVRCQTVQNFPGDQYLSKEAAREMVLRGVRPIGTDGSSVQFRHDPRLQWPSIHYYTVEQTEALYEQMKCPKAMIVGNDGWPFDEDKFGRCLELLKPEHFVRLPGSHHFHADPTTAASVAVEVLNFIETKL